VPMVTGPCPTGSGVSLQIIAADKVLRHLLADCGLT